MFQKGLTPILIIIVMATILVGGYLVYQKQPLVKPPQPITTANPDIKPSTQPTKQPMPTLQTTPTSTPKQYPTPIALQPSVKPGWKQYRDDEIGFTYQLPTNENWFANSHPSDSLCHLRIERNNDDQDICIRSLQNPKGLSRRNFFCDEVIYIGRATSEQIDDCLVISQIQEIKIGNRNALKIDFRDGGSSAGDYYILSNGNKIIVISDYYALFPKTPNPSGFSWKKLRDDIINTFYFD